MWRELQDLVAGMADPFLKELTGRLMSAYEASLRVWPAAQLVHHAYRGGFLEHVLSVAHVALGLARHYHADADLVLTGAVLHDIGKIEARLRSHRPVFARRPPGKHPRRPPDGARGDDAIAGFPPPLRTRRSSTSSCRTMAAVIRSPVVPMTIEAMILSASDDLDAKINQVRRAIAASEGEGEFTPYQARLGRVFWKGKP
jgi:3'-5' exoribonuclease